MSPNNSYFMMKSLVGCLRRLHASFCVLAREGGWLTQRVRLRQGSIAFGPQHPAAHGILRLQLQLSGEIVRWVDPQFGFLHRGSEKLMETRSVLQALPYFDRFDYVANLYQEHAYCLAVEALAVQPHLVAGSVQLLRALFDELSRLLNHLLTLSATALDLSVMGPLFWAFEEREVLMEVLERASGARMHTALYRPFAIEGSAITAALLRDITQFLTRCSRSLAGAFLGLLNNRSFKSRLALVGQVSLQRSVAYGLSGILARSAGLLCDLRVQSPAPYGLYRLLALRTFLGRRGDNFDRFLIRVKEVAEGFRTLAQLLQRLGGRGQQPGALGPVEVAFSEGRTFLNRGCSWVSWCRIILALVWLEGLSERSAEERRGVWSVQRSQATIPHVLELEVGLVRGKFTSMEALISHFRCASEGYPLAAGLAYRAVESPKGEVGVTLVSPGMGRLGRVKLRTPVCHNMHLIPTIAVGVTFADLVATFCSLDIVMGELDR